MSGVVKAIVICSTAFLLSLVLCPVVKRIGFAIKAYAVENNRTVHHGRIVRIGGLGVYLAFIITMAFFIKADQTINAVLIGGFIVFLGGLIDDIFDLKPIIKFAFQVIGALVVIIYGNIRLTELNLAFLYIDFKAISFVVSLFWIVGVTNAINLIDGLDGLSCGISSIVLVVIGYIAMLMGRADVCTIALILIGAILGFLPYNFHPASIFVGDCGALFMGFMISTLALMGFKTSAFVSLGFPIIILFVPLSDTCLAIIRRKLSGHKISEADKSHLHHVLMFKLGLKHQYVVLVLYLVTVLFGGTAILMYHNEGWGLLVLGILCLGAWIFIELTGMINPKFHPLINLCRKITGKPEIREDARFEANRPHHNEDKRA